MPEWLILVAAVLIFFLLWFAIDLVGGALPAKDAPAAQLKTVVIILAKAVLILVAVLWLAARYLYLGPGVG